MSMRRLLEHAATLHGGHNVYHSRGDCLTILKEVEALRPAWWNDRVALFVSTFARLCPDASERGSLKTCVTAAAPHTHPIVLVEGLDGVGKTRVTTTLAERLNGTVLCTPAAEWSDIRPLYRDEDAAIARCFYCAANYLAEAQIIASAATGPVVVDRWWSSTCAMSLANLCRTVEDLPPPSDPAYRWPTDLAQCDAGFLLSVEEAIRVARIRRRAPEDAEEKRLSSQAAMRDVAMQAYRRTGVLVEVPAPTYRVAVNTILSSLQDRQLIADAPLFTQSELDAVKPF